LLSFSQVILLLGAGSFKTEPPEKKIIDLLQADSIKRTKFQQETSKK